MSDTYGWLAIGGLIVISVLTRSFFFLSDRTLPFPDWLELGLKYAPLGALAAIIFPTLMAPNGTPQVDWTDPRIWAGGASALFCYWRKDMLMTIITGMAVFYGVRALN